MAEINQNATEGNESLNKVLKSILTDLTNLTTALNTLATKLNADAGVTDTNYATANALTTTGVLS